MRWQSVSGATEGNDSDVDFKVTLEIVGSMDGMNIRNATIQMDVFGGTVDGSSYVVEILGEPTDCSNFRGRPRW